MEAKFSEFQFAYSVTREIENRIVFSSLNLGMPHIPNQRDEASGGYDVNFQGDRMVSIFLQYKLPVKLTRSNATEWNEFKQDYFRITIYPDSESHQHNNLYKLAHEDRRNQVYYCAPAFISEAELECFHSTNMVAQNSGFINCYNLFPINGSDKHNICYTIDPRNAVMHSERKEIEIKSGWGWASDNKMKYDSLGEFVDHISKLCDIQIPNEDRLFGLKTISDHFSRQGVHMLLLKA